MEKWKIDIPVLCIFFARPEQFRQCFERVRQAKPRVLLLWQDGPREGRADDVENIQKCREIAENIDWECEVHKNYHEKNMGCDPSTFLSHKWAFSIVDKCIILEDDLVPSLSFFEFCKVLLDKYEFDTRIDRICGTNELDVYEDTPYDYVFSTRGHSWGWASWRRVAETWNQNYEFLDDEYTLSCLAEQSTNKKKQEEWLQLCKKHQSLGVPHWEEIIGARTLLYTGLVIFPRVNMVKNIGLDQNSTHTVSELKALPASVQRRFTMEAHEIDLPLNEPPYMIEDAAFEAKCREIAHSSAFGKRIKFKAESVFRKLQTGTFWSTLKAHFKRKG